MVEPTVSVGVMSGNPVEFALKGDFRLSANDRTITGVWQATLQDGIIRLQNESEQIRVEDGCIMEPVDYKKAFFELKDVTIGIDFHWERRENQQFLGSLRFIIEDEALTAVNILYVEDYLKSVISSEMSAQSPLEFLKTHAVISRSWLLAQIEKRNQLEASQGSYSTTVENEGEYIRWFDREDHERFDVCADDHCQRYQGITKATSPEVEQALEATRARVLTYNNEICDARFSKTCGGVSETFENVWENKPKPYLQKVVDNDRIPEGYDMDLTKEQAVEAWVKNSPQAFCNTTDQDILSKLLPDFDQETQDFYRWSREYTQEEISGLIEKRLQFGFGKIKDLVPVERGESGRLIRLKVVGTQKTLTIGKELIIRKAFSESHLYSSAFVVKKEGEKDGLPEKFIFYGAGWGHGVGLCQIGAGVMSTKGYAYEDILTHYFQGARIKAMYD